MSKSANIVAERLRLSCIEREQHNENPSTSYDRLAEMFFCETGLIAPGKDAPVAMGEQAFATRSYEWRKWIKAKNDKALALDRAALADFDRCREQDSLSFGNLNPGSYFVALNVEPQDDEGVHQKGWHNECTRVSDGKHGTGLDTIQVRRATTAEISEALGLPPYCSHCACSFCYKQQSRQRE